MTGINMTRVVVGGILAGLVLNVGEYVLNMFVVKAEMEAAVARMNLPPVGGAQIATFVTLAFVLGIATVWLYAAIRPRFGAGVNTALCAGATVWALAYLYPGLSMWTMSMWPTGTMVVGLLWRLGELLMAAVAGAWLYQEEAAPVPARV